MSDNKHFEVVVKAEEQEFKPIEVTFRIISEELYKDIEAMALYAQKTKENTTQHPSFLDGDMVEVDNLIDELFEEIVNGA